MNTEEKILHAALRTFIAKGFSASTREITKKAHVSIGLLYHYFPTKNDLIITLYEQCLHNNFNAMFNIFNGFEENDPDKLKKLTYTSWESSVDWGLKNWDEFQYLQLFHSSSIAGHFNQLQNEQVHRIQDSYLGLNKIGEIATMILDKGPTPFKIEIGRAAISTTTEFLHEYPQYRHAKEFMERAWNICWFAIGGSCTD